MLAWIGWGVYTHTPLYILYIHIRPPPSVATHKFQGRGLPRLMQVLGEGSLPHASPPPIPTRGAGQPGEELGQVPASGPPTPHVGGGASKGMLN